MSRGPEFVVSSSLSLHTLPDGTCIRDYEITGLIGEGGFGIVYLAYDHSLQRRVAIKEYMPAAMASRSAHSSLVRVKSDRHADTFKAGLKSFVNEARLLARFDHPSLVKVYRFWEENGTAYMAMPYYEGPTLKRALAELGHVPGEAELRTWLRPLLDALAVMHAAQCYHRDISPDNILLTPGGPLLLDFGAARRVIGDMTHALTVVLKPGFAPIEQYGEVSSMAQGAWTDLYALASVVYAAVTGHPPMSSVERLMEDRLQPLCEVAAGRYSEPFLTAIDAALAVRPGDRPKDVQAFRALLDGHVMATAPSLGFASTSAMPLELVPPPDTAPAIASLPVPTATVPQAPRDTRNPTATDLPKLLPTVATEPHPEPERGADPLHAAPAPTPIPAPAAAAATTPGPAGAPRNKTPRYAAAAAALAVALAVVAHVASRPPATESPTPTATPAPAPAPAIAPTPGLPMIDEAPARGDAPAAVSALMPAAPAQAASAASAVTPRREARAHRPAGSGPERPGPTNAAVTSSRCSDILQKASLEPLSSAEATFLKRECR